MTIKDKLISLYLLVGGIIQLFMLFFYGNWGNLDILMYIGFVLLVISLILILTSNVLKEEGGMENGKGFVTTKLVNTGIYSVIRHPIYGSLFYLFIGFALISQHPLSLFFGFSLPPLCYYFMIAEERMTINKFGNEYLEYMKRVPRINIVLGLWRLFKK
jgi:protein-S-isoprenylcysteine O-methyltransferase Ste14